MTVDRHFARLLAAVIVMIAASFAASVAQAHDGHAHHHAAPAAAATAAPTKATPLVVVKPDGKVVFQRASLNQGRARAATAIVTMAPAANADMQNDCGGGCDGLCCSMGMACCHTALTPATLAAVPAVSLSSALSVPQDASRPSLAPEALPKPPRSFA